MTTAVMDFERLIADKLTEGSIKNWCSDDSVPSFSILWEAQTHIYNRLRVPQMLQVQSGTLAQDASTITLPSGFVQAVMLQLTGSDKTALIPVLPSVHEAGLEWADASNLQSAPPTTYYWRGSVLQLDTRADKAYTYRLLYYGELARLTSDNPTNFLLTTGFRALRLFCMAGAYEHKKQGQMSTAEMEKAEMEIERLNAQHALALEGLLATVQVQL